MNPNDELKKIAALRKKPPGWVTPNTEAAYLRYLDQQEKLYKMIAELPKRHWWLFENAGLTLAGAYAAGCDVANSRPYP